jgi:hypothetical protein
MDPDPGGPKNMRIRIPNTTAEAELSKKQNSGIKSQFSKDFSTPGLIYEILLKNPGFSFGIHERWIKSIRLTKDLK